MAEFELDPYIERLIVLRETDTLAFAFLHPEVKKLIEEYEEEKEAARLENIACPNQQFYRLLFKESGMRIGDAMRRAKVGIAEADVRRTWILLGDPSGRLK